MKMKPRPSRLACVIREPKTRDVIFNERVMYKDRHNTTANDSKLMGLCRDR